MKKTIPTEYYKGRIKNLVEIVVRTIQVRPELVDNIPLLHACLASNLEGYGKPEQCFNCKRSMKVTKHDEEIIDPLLFINMSKDVKNNISKGIESTWIRYQIAYIESRFGRELSKKEKAIIKLKLNEKYK